MRKTGAKGNCHCSGVNSGNFFISPYNHLMTPPIQDLYPDDFAHCFGCGRHNPHGHQLKSFEQGEEVVAHFTPSEHHIAVPGFVYGGLLASLVDCHAMATAAAAAERAAGRAIGEGPAPRFVTAALHVEYLKPTPLGPPLEIRSSVTTRTDRKAVVVLTVSVEGQVTVRGEVVAVRIPETMRQG
jgi:acyl-coenzyme A thioesterase PaaI-like protein